MVSARKMMMCFVKSACCNAWASLPVTTPLLSPQWQDTMDMLHANLQAAQAALRALQCAPGLTCPGRCDTFMSTCHTEEAKRSRCGRKVSSSISSSRSTVCVMQQRAEGRTFVWGRVGDVHKAS